MNIYIYEEILSRVNKNSSDSSNLMEYLKTTCIFIIESIIPIITRAYRCKNNKVYLGCISIFMEWLTSSRIKPSEHNTTSSTSIYHLDPKSLLSCWKHTAKLLTEINTSNYLTEGNRL